MGKPYHIIFVDDDPDDAFILKKAFERARIPAHISHVESGEAFFALDHETPPELIVLDINMPIQNGVEVLETIKNDPELSDVDVIMYTTSAQPKHVKTCKELGALDILIKPTSMSHLDQVAKRIGEILVC